MITVFGIENNKCHYAIKVVDQSGAVLRNGGDCRVPKELITKDLLGHLFGNDKEPGQEKTLTEQTKIETDYCTQ